MHNIFRNEAEKMKIAFLISAFTDMPHLQRLIDSLPQEGDVYVHLDARCELPPCLPEGRRGDVHFISKRFKVMWGSFTQVRFQMELIRAALHSGTSYDYLFMLSGQDYPVWSNSRIVSYLEGLDGRNLLQGMRLVGLPRQETYEYTRYRFLNNMPWRYGSVGSKLRVALRTVAQPFLKKPLSFTADGRHYNLYKGSDYFAVTRELAEYVLQTYDNSPQLRRYFSNSFAPSETFTHTVAFNSRFAEKCMLTRGPVKGLEELTPLTYIEYGTKIKELTLEDYDRIMESGKMFCRKTVTGLSDELMDRIDGER